jgi:hypothetical protein
MTAEEILEQLRIYLDMFVDETKMENSIQHKDAMSAIDGLEHELNRKGLVERKRDGKGAMQ